MRFRRPARRESELDSTPLVDVMFNLIIFFLLSSSFIMQPGIQIKLPQARTSEVQPSRDIFILIDSRERVFLNDRGVKMAELAERLRGLIKEGRSKTVIIKADEVVRHGRVVEAMDIAKQVGVERLIIATQPRVEKRKERE